MFNEQYYQQYIEDHHPEFVRELIDRFWWWHDLDFGYRKPFYDPFEVFKPSKAFIKEKIKELNHQCYDIISEGNNNEFARILNQDRHERLLKRIRDYKYRLHTVPGSAKNNIGPSEIQRAKESPIQDHLVGWKFRRAGTTLVGHCPFHAERTGSFVIYVKSNTWHCYSCSEGTDSIDLVMKLNNLSFIEAVRRILPLPISRI